MSTLKEAWCGKQVEVAMLQYDQIANAHVSEGILAAHLYGILIYIFLTCRLSMTSPIVDISGGNSSLELSILKHELHHNLDFVIFDISETTKNAQKV
jgi:hypothetical protein